MNTFAERLKFAINKSNLSQAEAARKSGIAQQSINYIINNNVNSSKLAPQIASALGINPEWLVYGRGKLEETCVYEIPIFNTPYLLIKFLNQDIDENTVKYTVIEIDLGDNAFAYLIEPQKLAICSSIIETDTTEYLTLTPSSVIVSKSKGETSFAIFEWRHRYVNFF